MEQATTHLINPIHNSPNHERMNKILKCIEITLATIFFMICIGFLISGNWADYPGPEQVDPKVKFLGIAFVSTIVALIVIGTIDVLYFTKRKLDTRATFELFSNAKTPKLQNTLLNIYKINGEITEKELILIRQKIFLEISEYEKNAIDRYAAEGKICTNSELDEFYSDLKLITTYMHRCTI